MNVAFKRKFPIGSSHMKLIDVLIAQKDTT